MSRPSPSLRPWLVLGSCALATAVVLPPVPAGAAPAGAAPAGGVPATAPVARGAAGSAAVRGTAATSVPPAVTGLTALVGDHAAVLHWTGGGTAGAVVREVTGVAGVLDAAHSGRLVVAGTSTAAVPTGTAAPAGSAVDHGFGNTTPSTYAVWAVDTDGTVSSAPALVVLQPAARLPGILRLQASASTALGGTPVTLSGLAARGRAPLAGAVVDVVATLAGASTPIRLAHLTTSAGGRITFTWVPTGTAAYQLRFAGDRYTAAQRTAPFVVAVQPRLTAVLTSSTVTPGGTSHLRGALLPARTGVRLQVQQLAGSAWRTVYVVATLPGGGYDVPFSPVAGSLRLRVVLPASAAGLAATSAPAQLTVVPRTLAGGASGPAVTALEQRLQALHYDVGAVDGRFDDDLRHAVIAFEKVERLPRTATWGPAEQVRIQHPSAFSVRYPFAGRAIEVDITRQVLVMSQGGAVTRILDVSTGSERLYKQKGIPDLQVAHTPRGRYRITHKINGVRISPLGELYRPAYFYAGYAVHGNGSVPTTPQSHGCVRITDAAMDRLYDLLTVGTPVAVYDE